MVGSGGRDRRARLLAKTCWALAVAYAAWLATRGLGTGLLELDPAEIVYLLAAELPGATGKVRRDAGSLAVAEL